MRIDVLAHLAALVHASNDADLRSLDHWGKRMESTPQVSATFGSDQRRELKNLKWMAALALAYLGLVASVTIAMVTRLLLADDPSAGARAVESKLLVFLSMGAGALGSTLTALYSLADRISTGWTLADGTYVEPPGNTSDGEERFIGRMMPWWFVRPVLGAILGLVTYLGLRSGFLIATAGRLKTDELSREGLGFIALLSGLFAKTLIEKLRISFDALLGKSPRRKRPG